MRTTHNKTIVEFVSNASEDTLNAIRLIEDLRRTVGDDTASVRLPRSFLVNLNSEALLEEVEPIGLIRLVGTNRNCPMGKVWEVRLPVYQQVQRAIGIRLAPTPTA